MERRLSVHGGDPGRRQEASITNDTGAFMSTITMW